MTTGNLITVETRNITRFRLNTAAWQAAEKLAALDPIIDIRFPVKADTAITDQDTDRADLILMGTPATHSLIARIEAQLRSPGSCDCHRESARCSRESPTMPFDMDWHLPTQ